MANVINSCFSDGVLAHAFFPNSRPIGGDTHFDDDEAWTVGGAKGADLYYIATHEFGHALGLPHSGNKDSVMKPYYAGYVSNLKLHSEDVTQIQKRYGKSQLLARGRTESIESPQA